MDDKGNWCHCDGLLRRSHCAAAGEAEVDFGRLGVAVVGADLPGLPAGDGHVAVGDLAENFLDVMPGVPLLLAFQTEDMHGDGAPRMAIKPSRRGQRCAWATRVDRKAARARSSTGQSRPLITVWLEVRVLPGPPP